MTQDIRCITPVKVGDLHVEEILPILTEPQLTYATYLVLATWSGFPIACAQGSHEALKIHAFLSAFLMTHPRADLVSSISDLTSPLRFLIEFAAYFYQNLLELIRRCQVHSATHERGTDWTYDSISRSVGTPQRSH